VPDALRVALTLAAGFVTGMLSGMFGIGGAVVSNPSIRSLGATPLQSVGSTLPSIIPSAISGALRYHREGLLHTRIVVWTGLSGAVSSVAGSLLSDAVPGDGHALTMAIAILMGYTAVRTGRAGFAAPKAATDDPGTGPDVDEHVADGTAPGSAIGPIAEADFEMALRTDDEATLRPREEPWMLMCVGVAAGLFSGLLGIGGGLIIVPAFTGWLRLPLKDTLGTSLAAIGVIAVPGMVTHALLGHVNWAFALPLAIGVIPGSRIGAHMAIRTADRTLRLVVAAGLACVGAVYATNELLGLLQH